VSDGHDRRGRSGGRRGRVSARGRRPSVGRPRAPRTGRAGRALRLVGALLAAAAVVALAALLVSRSGLLSSGGSVAATGTPAPVAAAGRPARALVTSSPAASLDATASLAAARLLVEKARWANGILVGSLFGGPTRRFYGKGPVPEKLELIWRFRIGSGQTSGTASSKGPVVWGGSGWTGQCTLVEENGRLYLIASGYDHGLRRIDAETGTQVWRYEFPDVIKGTNTVFANPKPTGADDRLLVVCGSRRGFGLSMGDPGIAPVRCVTFGSGREVWRLPAPRTKAYSRDADSSGLLIDGSFYQAVESGYIYRLDPTVTQAWNGFRRPKELASALLYENSDAAKHGGNLLPEGSPTLVGDRLFMASGSGHVYGLSMPDLKKVWDFKTGSDLDSTIALTKTGKLVLGVEKQYIPGKGGGLMLDPSKPPAESVVWYFPTGDRKFADWLGGIIGSATINDEYDPDGSRPALAAFSAIDGFMYVVSQDQLAPGKVKGFDGKTDYPTPIMVAKHDIGGAISTPIFVDDYIIACGYDAKVHVYKITYDAPKGVKLKARDGKDVSVAVTEIASYRAGAFESTPIVWNGRIYVGSRDGYLYCLGEK
jgi:outer membrane protein assembly factor BamB